ncbi:MAG: asparagine synthase (glutamine-hydrolyzing) [Alphaproteobacteria bacterium]|nr:asparagine synthase (glutamine-hydrolyzing) [Alphaproteobacteria bacterium]
MCGLWASVGMTVQCDAIARVAHRGPDGEGWEQLDTPAGPLTLGHRRLSIIDRSPAGAQPMASADGRLRLVYNGEIYNHVELRAELENQGHQFRTRTDSEVILAAYDQWGADFPSRLNGMFAIVLWDASRRTLLAVRDRFGVKPLYWGHFGEGIAFASELKQFAAVPGFTAGIDQDMARDFLAFGLLDHDDRTLIQEVRQLGAGDMVELDLGGRRPGPVTPRRWYVPSAALAIRSGEAPEYLAWLLTDSVRLRLRADVSVGVCLSGGLDSSAIACLAAGQTEGPITTVSACYDDPAVDERRYIHAVTAAITATAIEVFPQADQVPDLIDRIVHAQDGPFSGTTVFAQWCVFEAARQAGVKVMLDGQGADELLAGYHPAFAAYHAGLARDRRWWRLAAEMAGRRRRHGVSFLRQGAEAANAAFRPTIHRFLRTATPNWLQPGRHAPSLPATPDLPSFLRSQFSRTSLPMLLHWEDRNSMAHGVEARLPFLDYRLVEFCANLADDAKIRDGETKWILRQAMVDILPAAIRQRQDKIGFATPERLWLQRPRLRAFVEATLNDAGSRFPELFDKTGLARLIRGVRTATSTPSTVWRVVSFVRWAVMGLGR